jgi:small-conductance mechanosensitive channel
LVVVTFAANRLVSNVRFIAYMILVRPFNIGDLLLVHDDLYRVTAVSPTYVSCLGRDTIVLKNSQMLDNVVRNYSRSYVNDSVSLEVPLNTRDDLVQIVRDRMAQFASRNWMQIKGDSIRCGWVAIRNQSRVLQCNWAYSFVIFDRTTFNQARTTFVNAVIQSTIDEVSRSFILANASQGSVVLNPVLLDHFHKFCR